MFISEVVKGGAAELDGRLMQGDQILSVDSEDTRQTSQETVAAMLKVYLIHTHTHSLTLLTCSVCVLQCARGPVQLELGRLKAASWVSSEGSQVTFFFFSQV